MSSGRERRKGRLVLRRGRKEGKKKREDGLCVVETKEKEGEKILHRATEGREEGRRRMLRKGKEREEGKEE